MNKVKTRWVIIDLILVAVYCLVFLVGFGVRHTTTVWINFVFILLSHPIVWVGFFLVTGNSKHFIVSTAMVLPSSAYVLIAWLCGTLLMILVPNNIRLTILVHAVLLLLYVAVLFINIAAHQHTESQEDDPASSFINQAIYSLLMIQSIHTDEDVKAKINRIHDRLRAGQYCSSSSTMATEQQIQQVLVDCYDSSLNKEEILKKLDDIIALVKLRKDFAKVV